MYSNKYSNEAESTDVSQMKTEKTPSSWLARIVIGAVLKMLGAFGVLPLPLRRTIGSLFGRFAALLPTTAARVCGLQLEIFAGVRSSQVASDSFANVGQTIFESFTLNLFGVD